MQDGLELEELTFDAELFSGEGENEELLRLNPSTGLSAGWTVSALGQQDQIPEESTSMSWSGASLSDSEFDLDDGTLQTSSRDLRKVIKKSQENFDPKEQAGAYPVHFHHPPLPHMLIPGSVYQ
jgi:hypothetical protein